ncbi:MAG: hypothetical protein ABMA02_10440 [Saprospiraceae bacterium]
MKLPVFSIILFASIVTLASFGCSKDAQNPDYIAEANCTGIDAATNTYTLSIKAIMDISCALGGCHDPITKSHNLDLSTYAGVKSGFQTHNLLCAVNHGSGCEPMPQGGVKLPADILNRLACWAKNGYVQ